jgi:hypothetical protein
MVIPCDIPSARLLLEFGISPYAPDPIRAISAKRARP